MIAWASWCKDCIDCLDPSHPTLTHGGHDWGHSMQPLDQGQPGVRWRYWILYHGMIQQIFQITVSEITTLFRCFGIWITKLSDCFLHYKKRACRWPSNHVPLILSIHLYVRNGDKIEENFSTSSFRSFELENQTLRLQFQYRNFTNNGYLSK